MLEKKTYKNYKELCKAMNWEIKDGNSKKAQFKELDTLCNYHKEGYKIIIDKIFDIKKEKIDGRINNKGGNNSKIFKNFDIPKEHDNSIGVYKIIDKNNNIYIGSTTVSFRERFKQHNKYNEDMKHTYNLLHNGGIFKIIEVMNNSSKIEIRKREQFYITKYINDKNYNVINRDKEVGYIGKKKTKFKNIKIPDYEYKKVIKLLLENEITFR